MIHRMVLEYTIENLTRPVHCKRLCRPIPNTCHSTQKQEQLMLLMSILCSAGEREAHLCKPTLGLCAFTVVQDCVRVCGFEVREEASVPAMPGGQPWQATLRVDRTPQRVEVREEASRCTPVGEAQVTSDGSSRCFGSAQDDPPNASLSPTKHRSAQQFFSTSSEAVLSLLRRRVLSLVWSRGYRGWWADVGSPPVYSERVSRPHAAQRAVSAWAPGCRPWTPR